MLQTKLFSDLYLAKFFNTSVKPFLFVYIVYIMYIVVEKECLHGKNGFGERSKILIRYRSEK